MRSLLAALGLFVAGAAVSVTHGVQELLHPTPATDFVVGPFNRFRIVRPVRRQRRVTGLFEKVRPVGLATRKQPEAVDEDDRSGAGGVCRLDLLLSRSEIDAIPNLLSVAVEG